jgi:hypothetical protein
MQSRTFKKMTFISILNVLVKLLFALQPISLLLWSIELPIVTDASIEIIRDENFFPATLTSSE